MKTLPRKDLKTRGTSDIFSISRTVAAWVPPPSDPYRFPGPAGDKSSKIGHCGQGRFLHITRDPVVMGDRGACTLRAAKPCSHLTDGYPNPSGYPDARMRLDYQRRHHMIL